MIDECATGTHDCDRNARCIDTDESFICTCREGFNDESPDPSEKPGRVCTQREFGRISFINHETREHTLLTVEIC